MNRALELAAVLGAATGIRSTSGLAILASTPAAAPPWLASAARRRLARGALVGESIADKVLPLPARTRPMPWMGRMVLAGVAAGAASPSSGSSRTRAVLTGALAAAATAAVVTRLRAAATDRGVPDVVPALGEDVAVLALGVMADRLLEGAPVAGSEP